MITQQEFFEQFDLDMEMLPYGVEDLAVKIAVPRDAENICWDFLMHNSNKINLDKVIEISDNFEFVSDTNVKFILTRRVT